MYPNENLQLALDAVLASRVEPDSASRAPADIDGQPFDLEPADNETHIVYHFATWCETYLRETDPDRMPQCREFREGINRLAARKRPGLRIIGFATRNGINPERVRQYREQHGIGLCALRTGGKCGDCANQAFVPVSERVVLDHLTGS